MSTTRILVTGATGKTGSAIVEQLLERGFSVRAMVRRHDQRSAALANLGASIVVADFHELGSIRRAVQDVQRAYFCYPPQGTQLVEATAIFAIAARDAGVEAVVNMSQVTAREDAPSPLSRQHWQSELILDWADLQAAHVRPTFFAENLIMFAAETIAAEGKLYLPYGNGRHAPVTAADIARVVTTILAAPDQHVGERYILTGPKNLTIAEMAEELASGLGRPVEYVDLPIDAWGQVLAQRPDATSSLVTHLTAVAREHQLDAFDVQTDQVEQITGQPAQSLADFIQETRAAFSPATTAGR